MGTDGGAVELVVSGVGADGCVFELRAQYLEHLAKKEAFNSVKRVAGILAAGSTAMDAVQAFINMKKPRRTATVMLKLDTASNGFCIRQRR